MASEQTATSQPRSHLSDDMLIDYASGAADEALALLIAAHLDYCPDCRKRLAEIEAVGGALLDSLPPAPLEHLTLDGLLARIEAEDETGESAPTGCRDAGLAGDDWLPAALKPYVAEVAAGTAATVEDWPWKTLARDTDKIDLPVSRRCFSALLLRVRAGAVGPRHGHTGNELVLVMCGSYVDDTGTYQPGDVTHNGPNSEHRPVAGPERDCICLVIMDAPLRLAGPLGRLLSLFSRR